MQRRSPDKIGAWEVLLLVLVSVVLCLSVSDDQQPDQPVNSYTYQHHQRPLSDAEFLDGEVVNAAETQGAGR